MFVWRQDHADDDPPRELFEPFGATNVERDDDAEWVRERGYAFYVGHAAGRNELHLERERADWAERHAAWYASRDPALLVREPCLSEEATYERLAEELAANLAARGGDTGLGVSLGDEVGLTPQGSPSDVCRSPACEAAWRAWCDARGLDPGRAPTTDEARLALTRGDASLVGPWLARRRFHQDVVVDLLERLAARSRELAPDAPVGLLGLAGQTAFGGVAVERALGFVDFLEPYEAGRSREIAFTAREPGQRLLRTLFVQSGARAHQHAMWVAWEHWMRGGDGLVIWSDRLLAADDRVRVGLGLMVEVLRIIDARNPAFDPRPTGAAIVFDPECQAYSWLRHALGDGPTWPRRFASYHEEHGALERAQRTWIDALQDAGAMPGAIPLESVDASTVERFGLLVLPHLAIVDDAELAALGAYLDAGGRLVVDGPFAERDADGGDRDSADCEALFARAPGRVHAPVEGLGEYARIRLRLPTPPRARLVRAQLRELLETVPGALAPIEVAAVDERPPATITWSSDGEGGWIVAVLPNLRNGGAEPTEFPETRIDVRGRTDETIKLLVGAYERRSAPDGENSPIAAWHSLVAPPGTGIVVHVHP